MVMEHRASPSYMEQRPYMEQRTGRGIANAHGRIGDAQAA
jgi:hypothetical protein